MTVKSEKGLILNKMSFPIDKGLNYLEYDLAIRKEMVAKYQKELNKNSKKEVILEEAENDKFYLYKGDYEIILEAKGEKITKDLKIFAPKRKRGIMPNPESGERD